MEHQPERQAEGQTAGRTDSSERSTRAVAIAALLLLILAGAWLRTQEWSDPWAGMHRAWGGAVYANMARNLVRYDIGDSKLGLIASSGVVEPEDFEFYYHHPPLNVWAMALCFRLFGVSEASARAVGLAASIAGILLLYALTAELYSRRAALASAALLAFFPAEAYYADHVDPYGSLGLSCTLLAVFAYTRWIRTHAPRDLSLCTLGVLGGCLTTWTPYFAVPLLLLHAGATLPTTQWRARAGLLLLPVCGVAAFAFFVFHRYVLLGSAGGVEDGELYGSLLEKLASRGAWASWFGAEGPSASAGWLQHGSDSWRLFTPVPLALFAVWTLDWLRRCFTRDLSPRDGIPWILIGYGLLHSLAFPGTLHGHDFLVRCYSAGLALTGGISLASGFDWLRAKAGWVPALACAAIALGVWMFLALPRVAELRVRSWNPATVEARAGSLRRLTNEDTWLLMTVRSERVFQYYLDRPLEFEIRTAARLKKLTRQGRDAVWVVAKGQARAASQSLRDVAHSEQAAGQFVLFRLSQPGDLGHSATKRPSD